MHLVPASFEPQLINGDILQYCKGLTASIESNHTLVMFSQHATWRFHLLERTPPEGLPSTSLERPLSGTANQPLCC